MILLAVVAASPGTIRMEGTYIMPKIPSGNIIRYRNPAILAVFLFVFIFFSFLTIPRLVKSHAYIVAAKWY